MLDESGAVVGVEGVTRDITERVEAEQLTSRLGRIVEDSVNEIYVFDAESLKFCLVNRGARENLGYSFEELLALTPLDLKPEFTMQTFLELLTPLRQGSVPVVQFETVHRRKDGSSYDVDIRLQYAATEKPPVYVAILQDITQNKRIRGELVQAQKMEAVGQLTGGISP